MSDLTLDDLADAWGCSGGSPESFRSILAAHDAEVRADEREKAATDACVRAFKVMRAHEFMVRSILSKEDEPDSEQAAKAVVAYLIHAADMDAKNAAAARGEGTE